MGEIVQMSGNVNERCGETCKEKAKVHGKRVADSCVEMTELILPNDANPLGTMLGGRVMHFIDIAGAISASRFCLRTVVTASIDSIDFYNPAQVGDVLILKAQVTWAGRTSMEVRVEVMTENLITAERALTCRAYLTFVAIDENRKPVEVPAAILETEEERNEFEAASKRRIERMKRLGRI